LDSDQTFFEQNQEVCNNTIVIAVANFCEAQGIDPTTCAAHGIEPNSDDTHVLFNQVTGNGTNPDPRLIFSGFAVDLAWDLTGIGNCWTGNEFDTSFPPALPACS